MAPRAAARETTMAPAKHSAGAGNSFFFQRVDQARLTRPLNTPTPPQVLVAAAAALSMFCQIPAAAAAIDDMKGSPTVTETSMVGFVGLLLVGVVAWAARPVDEAAQREKERRKFREHVQKRSLEIQAQMAELHEFERSRAPAPRPVDKAAQRAEELRKLREDTHKRTLEIQAQMAELHEFERSRAPAPRPF